MNLNLENRSALVAFRSRAARSAIAVGLGGYFFPVLRDVKKIVPDYESDPQQA